MLVVIPYSPDHPFGFSELMPLHSPCPTIRCPEMAPNPCQGWTPHLQIDYSHQVWDIRLYRARNLYAEDDKDPRLEYRFWNHFHFDFYKSLIYHKYLKRNHEAPVIQVKVIDTYELGKFTELELKQMVTNLHRMGLYNLMEFQNDWNNEIICQFYASYHHEKSPDGTINTIHWTTEGKHYKVDFLTFSHLLGLLEADRKRKELSKYGDVALRAYRHMYLDGYRPDTKTVYLKPYFYVLNTILRQILC